MKKNVLAFGMVIVFTVTLYSCISSRAKARERTPDETGIHAGPKTSGPKPPKNP